MFPGRRILSDELRVRFRTRCLRYLTQVGAAKLTDRLDGVVPLAVNLSLLDCHLQRVKEIAILVRGKSTITLQVT